VGRTHRPWIVMTDNNRGSDGAEQRGTTSGRDLGARSDDITLSPERAVAFKSLLEISV
jgi:hypothetical protein